MALRLRRGTDAQRAAVLPQEGELIFATDTQKLWVGAKDGTGNLILGGVPVDVANANFSIDFLNDVDTTSIGFSPSDGQSLVWSAADAKWRPGNADVTNASISDLSDVEFTSAPTQGQVLKWSSAQGKFIPNDDIANSGLVQDDTYQIGINGDVYAADGTSKVLENGTDGSDATFTGIVTAGAGSTMSGTLTGNVNAADNNTLLDATNKELTGSVKTIAGDTVINATTGDVTVSSLIMSTGGSVTGDSLTIGTDTITAFTGTATPSTGWFNLAGYYDSDVALRMTAVRTRGTVFSPTALQDQDEIFSIALAPYDGTNYLVGGAISSAVLVDGGNYSTSWNLAVRDGASSTTVNALEITPSSAQYAVPPAVPAFADASARDTAITAPTVGMLVITGSIFQGYTGSTWVDLN